MDRTTNTGGSAFPQNTKVVLGAGQVLHEGFMGGMTLRDYFAAKAMQGLLATGLECGPEYVQAIADLTYAMADAMLKARKGP